MSGFRAKVKAAVLVIFVLAVGFAALYGLLKPISNGCTMTYMYPTYIPILASESLSSSKYGLYLYHEGWKKIDYKEHLKKLNGVPVLFIPGNGGSYKQVRSLAAESHRAYQNGPLEHTFHQDASLSFEEMGSNSDVFGFQLPNKYASRLDWFAVDLEGEHSAMDGAILEEHTEYVVYAIHKILDQYRESFDARAREGAAASGSLPKSVILVGHSMGGFVARAATIHPHLRKSAVETIITLSTPHQSPPVAFQPSLGYYFARVNEKWKEGYNTQTTRTGHYASDPLLSHVVIVSISGGYNDYQVRTKLESLDNIVPPTHGFMISSTAMKNVWLSMEHQAILWCNQLVIQVSHTLLSLVDSGTGHPLPGTIERLEVFTRMLRSGISQNFIWMMQPRSSRQSIHIPPPDGKDIHGSSVDTSAACPSNIHWKEEGLERDLYIQTTTVTVLAMDGRRRWLDIQKVPNGKSHFIFVTNLEPCSGVRLHLWPERGKSASSLPLNSRVLDVTSKLMRIPSGPAPRQMEPGSQTEQPPPTSVFWLGPEDMRGFRFLTISVAPLPTISGRPPPAASMAVGQFYDPKEGTQDVSSRLMLQSLYSTKEMLLNENHPLAFNLSFSMSLGLLPITLSLKTLGCGINNSGFPEEEAGDVENSRLCKLRCFPPVALAWDEASGLHIFPNLFSETIVVDSSPALLTSTSWSDKTTVVLLVDPHCSYKASFTVSVSSAASRFLLLYSSKIVGFSVAVIFFALMRQAYAWDLDLPIPSMLKAVESNLTEPSQFFPLAILPILFSLLHSFLLSNHSPPILTFAGVSLICYLLANGLVAILILISHLVFYVVAILHVFLKTRCRVLERNLSITYFQRFINLSSGFVSLKGVRVLRANPTLVKALSAIALACLVHPALGLLLLILSHILYCHDALCSFLTASFRSHMKIKEFIDSRNEVNNESEELAFKLNGSLNRTFSAEEEYASSPDSSKSFIDTQLDMFHHHHGLLTLHLIASLMFAPSLVAWLQRFGTGQSFPWILDSILCTGVILHGVCNSLPKFNSVVLSLPSIPIREVRLYFLYLIAGYWSYFSGMTFAPYRVFYLMAAIGVISFSLRILERRKREKGKAPYVRRKHSHRH